MERIRPVNPPEDDEQGAASPERFSPYAIPLSTLVASVYVSRQDQSIAVPDLAGYLDAPGGLGVPVGPEGGGGDGD